MLFDQVGDLQSAKNRITQRLDKRHNQPCAVPQAIMRLTRPAPQGDGLNARSAEHGAFAMLVAQKQMERTCKPLCAQLWIGDDIAPPGLVLKSPRECFGNLQIVRVGE